MRETMKGQDTQKVQKEGVRKGLVKGPVGSTTPAAGAPIYLGSPSDHGGRGKRKGPRTGKE